MCNLGVLSDLNVKKIAYLVSGDCLYTTSWEDPPQTTPCVRRSFLNIFYAHRMQTCGGEWRWTELISKISKFFLIFFKF